MTLKIKEVLKEKKETEDYIPPTTNFVTKRGN